jgi:hypothetical protein
MSWTERCGRGLMLLAALGALGAFAGGIGALESAGPERFWVESWRTYGFLVFAGLFALLAWRPTGAPLVWELVFLHKAAMAGSWHYNSGAREAAMAGPVDLGLGLATLAAWLLTCGWRSWRAQSRDAMPRP